jgi:hypothetical protein
VKKVSEYRQHAAECRALAAKMAVDENREQMLEMAATWDRLADERARSLETREPAAFGSDLPG